MVRIVTGSSLSAPRTSTVVWSGALRKPSDSAAISHVDEQLDSRGARESLHLDIERVFARRQGGESHPPLLIRPLFPVLRSAPARARDGKTQNQRHGSAHGATPQRYRANNVPRETGILLLRSSHRLHRVQIHVIGDCLAHPIADCDGARIMHAAPDPRVVAVSACGRNAGVHPAAEIDAR